MGIPEDPVTGSAHSVLAPYWAARLEGSGSGGAGAPVLHARQCSPRGGDLRVSAQRGEGQVRVTGPAVVVVAGALRL